MELFHIGLQFIEQLLLVLLGRADVPVTGQVLCLPQVVYLHPMGNDRCPDLIEVFYRMIDLPQVLQDGSLLYQPKSYYNPCFSTIRTYFIHFLRLSANFGAWQ
jgi:hypothetical protein